ncbi:hypothetical protein LMG23992_01557 [Cupriavidus laharis]|uniref:Uncharacterized protein n=1 Tax=Cupriavidus laharis TaxID=151654 RepID=A0ABM8WSA9_9BURK|nr:hypothetical protein LMG23992_01557 [Cupriavidus laharis]
MMHKASRFAGEFAAPCRETRAMIVAVPASPGTASNKESICQR